MSLKSASTADFNEIVINRSYKVPVIVDFWAPWCGPCRFLGPVIEELASEAGEKWELVKINTDENQELSVKYSIRGIPAVKMFYRGEVIAGFTGALPRHQIESWMAEHLPDERKMQLETIKGRLANQEPEALAALEDFANKHPDLEEARLVLATHQVFDNPAKAKKMVEDISLGHKYFELAEDVRTLAELMECNENGNSRAEEKLTEARNALKTQNEEAALQNLINAVMIDKQYGNELPRRATIALFHVLGNDHPLTKKYRRRFDMALY